MSQLAAFLAFSWPLSAMNDVNCEDAGLWRSTHSYESTQCGGGGWICGRLLGYLDYWSSCVYFEN